MRLALAILPVLFASFTATALLLTLLFAMVLGISGCSKTPDKVDVNAPGSGGSGGSGGGGGAGGSGGVAELIKMMKENGGQPGVVKLSGALVQANSQLDPQVKLQVQGGVSKNKKVVEVRKENQPLVSVKPVAVPVLAQLKNNNELIAIGCPQAQIDQAAARMKVTYRPLTKKDLKPKKGVVTLAAKGILLCGSVKALQDSAVDVTRLELDADDLILANVDYTRISMVGSLVINANQLILEGQNTIATKSLTGNSSAPDLSINVVERLSHYSPGSKLLVKSTGTDAVEDFKTDSDKG